MRNEEEGNGNGKCRERKRMRKLGTKSKCYFSLSLSRVEVGQTDLSSVLRSFIHFFYYEKNEKDTVVYGEIDRI